jgi:hypothetical protein
MVASVRWVTLHNPGDNLRADLPMPTPGIGLTARGNLAGAALGRRAALPQRFLARRRLAWRAAAGFFALLLLLPLLLALLLALRATGGLTTL